MPASSIQPEHKNLMQAGAMLQKRKVIRSRAALCLDAGLPQRGQVSLGEASICLSRLETGSLSYTTQVSLSSNPPRV